MQIYLFLTRSIQERIAAFASAPSKPPTFTDSPGSRLLQCRKKMTERINNFIF